MPAPSPTIDVRLQDEPLHYAPLDPFPQPAGGECVFFGRTRRETHPEHGALRRLEYEAYDAMARRVLDDLAAEAAARFDCLAVRVHHRTGLVPAGEASVIVQVVCAHRDASFEACRFLIDTLKLRAPIWKREVWADTTTWVQGRPVATPDGSPGPASGERR